MASWGARTVMTPLIAVAGFLSYQFLGTFAAPRDGGRGRAALRDHRAGGGFFLYTA